jgi:thioredoxin 1
MGSYKKKEEEKMEVAVDDVNFKEEVLNSDIPALVDFWAEWCAPCLMVAPVLKEIAKEYKEKLKVCKVNVDNAPNTASKYGIMSIPTLAIFKNGKVVDKVVGALPKAELEPTIKRHI